MQKLKREYSQRDTPPGRIQTIRGRTKQRNGRHTDASLAAAISRHSIGPVLPLPAGGQFLYKNECKEVLGG